MPIRSVFICQIETIKSFTLASFKNKLTYQGLSFLIFKMGFICGIFKKKKKIQMNLCTKQKYTHKENKRMITRGVSGVGGQE